MRKTQSLVMSLGALLSAALIALAGCGASPNPGADRGEVGVPPDAAVTDRSIPPEDHMVLDVGDESVVDASVPADVLPDVATDATPPADAETPDVPALPPCGQTPATAGEHCSRPFPPGMSRGPTEVGRYVCPPRLVTVGGPGRMTVSIALSCDTGDDGLDYLSVRDVIPGGGFIPCVGMLCFYYRGSMYETVGIEWGTLGPGIGTVVSWAPGVTPGMGPSTPVPGAASVTYDL